MPESGPYGSVRGALSNERPYRDRFPVSVKPFGAKPIVKIFQPGLLPRPSPSHPTWNQPPTPAARCSGMADSIGHLPGLSATKAMCAMWPGRMRMVSRQ